MCRCQVCYPVVSVCVCVCEVLCKWLWSPLVFKAQFNFPQLSPVSLCFPCSQSHHLDAAGCLSAPHSHSPTLHAHTHNSPAVNSPMCGQIRLKIVLLSLWFQNICVCQSWCASAHTLRHQGDRFTINMTGFESVILGFAWLAIRPRLGSEWCVGKEGELRVCVRDHSVHS